MKRAFCDEKTMDTGVMLSTTQTQICDRDDDLNKMTTMIQEKEEAAGNLSETQRRIKQKKRRKLIFWTLSLLAITALVTVVTMYAGARKANQKLESQLQLAEQNNRAAQEKIAEALHSDSIAKIEKQNADLALEEARQRIAVLESEIAERNHIEVEKYLASARRMMRVGDREMAHQILLEAQKLERSNAEIIALLKEIE